MCKNCTFVGWCQPTQWLVSERVLYWWLYVYCLVAWLPLCGRCPIAKRFQTTNLESDSQSTQCNMSHRTTGRRTAPADCLFNIAPQSARNHTIPPHPAIPNHTIPHQPASQQYSKDQQQAPVRFQPRAWSVGEDPNSKHLTSIQRGWENRHLCIT